jgi:nucleoside-diphosphate-sugar epimerase
MNILIIGGGGYLGVPLSNKLTSLGHFVMVYDNFKHNTQDKLKCSYVNKSVEELSKISETKFNSYDVIFYLAQPRLEELTFENQIKKPIEDFQKFLNEVEGPKIYFISSCSVYGKTNNIVNENSPVVVTSYYSQMKIYCEHYLLGKQNPNFKILRLSTLYGDSDPLRNDVFINNILEDIIEKKEIEIYDPTAKRPHLHVLDCVNILSHLIDIEYDDKILNIGKNELNINKIGLIEIMKLYSDFNFISHDTEDSRDYSVNFDLLKKYIDFEHINYHEGIVNYLKKSKKALN